MIIKKAFEGSGLDLKFVVDGKEAIAYLKTNDPEVVLLDWNLP